MQKLKKFSFGDEMKNILGKTVIRKMKGMTAIKINLLVMTGRYHVQVCLFFFVLKTKLESSVKRYKVNYLFSSILRVNFNVKLLN